MTWNSNTKKAKYVVSIEFSPLITVDLTTNWYQWHNGDYEDRLQILEHSFVR